MGIYTKLRFNALNIIMHPHPKDCYINLFLDSYNSRQSIRIYGNQYAEIHKAYKKNFNNETIIEGKIIKYTHVDSTEPWYNKKTAEIASYEEMNKINIPEDLEPEGIEFTFFFFPSTHTFVYVSKHKKSFSVNLMKKFLEGLFNIWLKRNQDFDSIDVLIHYSREALQKIFELKNIKRLTIKITRPNGDTNEGMKENFLKHLEKSNIHIFEQTVDSAKSKEIIIDDELKSMSEIAHENGEVKAEIKDEYNTRKEISTKDVPEEHTEIYNSKKDSTSEAEIRGALSLISKLNSN